MKPGRMVSGVAQALFVALLLGSTQAVGSLLASDRGEVRIAGMEIDIWPEYDDPRVLVIYSGLLAPEVEVPTEFSFIIPRGAQIHMAGAIGPKGEHLHAAFETSPRGENLTEVSYSLQTRKFYMEFYYDPFPAGENRQFRYPLVSPYAIASLLVKVQQPLKARDFRTTPVAVNVIRDQKGFNYHRLVFGEMPANEERFVTVSYVKKDRNPSVAKAGTTAATGGSKAMKNILIVGGLLLVGVIGYGVFSNSRSKRSAPVRAGARRAAKQQPPAHGPGPVQPGEVKYCTECGTQMRRSDKFCPNCGTKAVIV